MAARVNRPDTADDLLHDAILTCIEKNQEKTILDPIAWIKVKIYNDVTLPRSEYHRTYTDYDRKACELIGDITPQKHSQSSAIKIAIAKYFYREQHFVERTLINMKLDGFTAKEISERFDLPYHITTKLIRESIQTLARLVNNS